MNGSSRSAELARRLAAQRHHQLLESIPAKVFDDLAALAASVAGLPGGMIAVLDGDWLSVKARVGLETTDTPGDASLCDAPLTAGGTIALADARQHPLLREHPLVAGEAGIRGYVGTHLRMVSGEVVGALCVFGPEVQGCSQDQIRMVEAVGRQVVAQLELRMSMRRQAQAAELLRLARVEAEASDRAKSAFLAGMSHELRTPLNSIIGFTNVLLKNKNGNLSRRDISLLQRVQVNGTHLLELLNGVLDLSKVEAGKLELEVEEFPLHLLIDEVAAHTHGSALERSVLLRVQPIPASWTITGDRLRLKQVLVNLVGNGLRFAEQGVVEVSVEADAEGPLRIWVSDDGIGIAPEKHEAVFEAFAQAESGTARRFGGTGLGLAISRSLCRAMGFELELDSEEDQGATFAVRLRSEAPPLVHRAPEAATVTEHTASFDGSALYERHPSPATRPRVMVLDQDRHIREQVAMALEEAGYLVEQVGNDGTALRRLRAGLAGALVFDFRTPLEGGLAFVERLRAEPGLAELPVVALTPRDLRPDEGHTLWAEACVLLRKDPDVAAGVAEQLERAFTGGA